MKAAWEKLRGTPIQIPHEEHRQLHLLIYSRLEHPFVTGLLEAFWEAYETVGLSRYADYLYLQQVWNYHQQIVDAICSGNAEAGHKALIEHKDLLTHRQE
jgi:DNA-binding FadR family transcriptional regulator